MNVIAVEVPKTVVVTDTAINVVEIAHSDEITVLSVAEQGPPGPSGTAATFIHQQSIPSSSWAITHGLDKYPSVSVVDSAGSQIISDVTYHNPTSLTVTFSAAFSGNAYLN